MANFGLIAGGIAQGYQAGQEMSLKRRALSLQEKSLQQEQQQALLGQVDKATANSMQIIADTIKSGAEGLGAADDLSLYRDAIASIESEGSGGYQAVGPVTKSGDKAYGKYQVMGANIPAWTQEVLGRAMTPDEFLANAKAQDAVFDAKFGQFVAQYGSPIDAASVWFTGRPLAQGADAQDVLGTTGKEYADKFITALNQAPKNKLKAAVEPILKSVEAMNGKVGRDPAVYRQQVDAILAGVVTPAQKALVEGQATARKRIAETNALIQAGVGRAEAMATAGIKTPKEAGTEAEPLSPKDAAELSQKLRKEFTDLSGTFIGVRDAYQRMEGASANPSPAGDMSLIFNFMKMLDPTSTVREGEYASAENARGVPSTIAMLYNKVIKGERLSDDQRADFLKQANALYTSQEQQYSKVRTQFTGIAQKAGLDPNDVILDFDPVQAASANDDPLGIR